MFQGLHLMPPKALNHAQIAARIPHAGSMCLLDAVHSWNKSSIDCVAINHTDLNHPLRMQESLPALTLVEYAAQAMAVHGSLLQASSDTQPAQGRLVSVRQVELFTNDLTQYPQPIQVHCDLLLGDSQSSTFSFTAHSNGMLLGQGRASVMLVKP
jgi:predicted hotdog family 3-hydroxylacyl-ACP dehydratase